jgi:hypothetical protein
MAEIIHSPLIVANVAVTKLSLRWVQTSFCAPSVSQLQTVMEYANGAMMNLQICLKVLCGLGVSFVMDGQVGMMINKAVCTDLVIT